MRQRRHAASCTPTVLMLAKGLVISGSSNICIPRPQLGRRFDAREVLAISPLNGNCHNKPDRLRVRSWKWSIRRARAPSEALRHMQLTSPRRDPRGARLPCRRTQRKNKIALKERRTIDRYQTTDGEDAIAEARARPAQALRRLARQLRSTATIALS